MTPKKGMKQPTSRKGRSRWSLAGCGRIYVTNWGRLVRPEEENHHVSATLTHTPRKIPCKPGERELLFSSYSWNIQTRSWSQPPTTTIRHWQSPSAGVHPSDVRTNILRFAGRWHSVECALRLSNKTSSQFLSCFLFELFLWCWWAFEDPGKNLKSDP